MHKTIQQVTEDIEAFKFNTAIAAMMEFVNKVADQAEQHGPSAAYHEATETLMRLLAPFAPHIAEELWARRGNEFSVHQQPWPTYDPALIIDDTLTLIIQVDGRVRDRVMVPRDIADQDARRVALKNERVQHYLNDRPPVKVVVVPGKLVNVVT
jgi:leucyl-tRNA synthetase